MATHAEDPDGLVGDHGPDLARVYNIINEYINIIDESYISTHAEDLVDLVGDHEPDLARVDGPHRPRQPPRRRQDHLRG